MSLTKLPTSLPAMIPICQFCHKPITECLPTCLRIAPIQLRRKCSVCAEPLGCVECQAEAPIDKPDSSGSPEYLKLLSDMADLHKRKNAGYAGGTGDPWSNFREADSLGSSAFTGVLIRMSDKWSRIKSLKRNPANDQVNESMRDTLFDLAAYSLIAICLIDEINKEELC